MSARHRKREARERWQRQLQIVADIEREIGNAVDVGVLGATTAVQAVAHYAERHGLRVSSGSIAQAYRDPDVRHLELEPAEGREAARRRYKAGLAPAWQYPAGL